MLDNSLLFLKWIYSSRLKMNLFFQAYSLIDNYTWNLFHLFFPINSKLRNTLFFTPSSEKRKDEKPTNSSIRVATIWSILSLHPGDCFSCWVCRGSGHIQDEEESEEEDQECWDLQIINQTRPSKREYKHLTIPHITQFTTSPHTHMRHESCCRCLN